VFYFNLDPTLGSEMRKARPCVVVMYDPNGKSAITIVCPLTDARGRSGNLLNPFVPSGVGGATKDSRVTCHQIRALDKSRITGVRLGVLPAEIMDQVSRGRRAVLGLA